MSYGKKKKFEMVWTLRRIDMTASLNRHYSGHCKATQEDSYQNT